MKTVNLDRAYNNQTDLIKLRSPRRLRNQKSVSLRLGEGDIETLIWLGLTGRQARVYLALLKLGTAKAKTIAKLSLVNRQEIYRVIDSLQEKGLVERRITEPASFTPTPINEGLQALIQRKTKEFSKVRLITKRLTEKFSQGTLVPSPENPCLGKISEGDHGKKLSQALENVHKTMDIVITWQRFTKEFTIFDALLKKALRKKVMLRVITQKPEKEAPPTWITQALTKKTNFKLKTQLNRPPVTAAIFDEKTIILALSATSDLKNGPSLWSNNPIIVTLIRIYFEHMWTQPQ